MKKVFTMLLIIVLFLSGCRLINDKNNHNDVELTDVEIILYFGDSQAMYVVPEKRIISINQDVSKEEYLKLIVEELIKGPKNDELYPTIPSETKVLNIELEDDLVYLDFSKEMQTKHWGGAAGENMTLLSLANTMTEIEYIERVIPSVEGTALNIEHVIVDEPLVREEDKILEN
ncbi:MAG: GerMN domain-containing protein [Firmicutes bacterium]|nr:GerMN domain-containing protein [Bacillota bacterium]